MAFDWSTLIPSAAPIQDAELDPDKVRASGDPMGMIAAAKAGVPYQAKPGQMGRTLTADSPQPQSSPIGGIKLDTRNAVPGNRPALDTQNASPNTPLNIDPAVQRTGVSSPPSGGVVTTNDAETPSGPQAVPSTVSPSGSNSRFSDVARQMLSQKQQALQGAQSIPNAPDVGGLEAQRVAAMAKAPNPNDASYKPTLKSRFLRGLEGVGLGLAEGGLRGAIAGGIAPQTTGLAGYRDPNSAFSRDKSANDTAVSGLDQQIKAAQDQQKDVNGRVKNATEIANSEGTGVTQATEADKEANPPKAGKAQIITAGDGSLFSVDPDDPSHPTPITGPDGKPITGKSDGKYVQLEIGGKPHTVEVDDKGNTIKDLGATGEKPTNIHVGEGGTWSLQEQTDGKGGTKTVLMNSKSGDIKDAPSGVQKIGTSAKNQAAEEKANEKYENVISSGATAHQLQKEAESGNAEADPALALLYFKAIKGSDGTGIRFTNTEADLIKHARNYGGDLEAIGQKVAGGGQMFTKDQRKNVVKIVDVYVQAAQRARASKSVPGGAASGSDATTPGAPAKSGGFNWDDHPKVKP